MAGEDLNYPGVFVVERPFLPRQEEPRISTYAAFVGTAYQGPTEVVRVGSWSEFVTRYGTNYTDLHYAVYDYYANGGRLAYIRRIPGATAATATVNIYETGAPEDPENPGQVLPGHPPLITVEALNPGDWANTLVVMVYARDTTARRFDMALFKVPSTVTFDPTKRNSEYMLEQWIDLSLNPQDTRYAYTVVNAPSDTGSSYIEISGQSWDPDAAPNTWLFPDTTGENELAGGTNGTYLAPTFDSEEAYEDALSDLTQIPGPYILNVPNVSTTNTLRYAIDIATNRGDVFVVIDPPANLLPADFEAWVTNTLALPTLAPASGSYVGVYYPRLYMPALTGPSGTTSLRPAGGAVVGQYMQTDAAFGPWKTPAGVLNRVSGAVDLERNLTDVDLTRLNNSHINAIRALPGHGIVLFGGRTLKKYGIDRYISVRRSVIFLREILRRSTEFAVFEPNDERLWARLTATCSKILGDFWQQGGLKGATAGSAYYVVCNESNNTPATVEAGEVHIEVGVALAVPAEFIIISIGQFQGQSTATASI